MKAFFYHKILQGSASAVMMLMLMALSLQAATQYEAENATLARHAHACAAKRRQ